MGDDDCFESESMFGADAVSASGAGGTTLRLPVDEDDYLMPSNGSPANSPPAYMDLVGEDQPSGERRGAVGGYRGQGVSAESRGRPRGAYPVVCSGFVNALACVECLFQPRTRDSEFHGLLPFIHILTVLLIDRSS